MGMEATETRSSGKLRETMRVHVRMIAALVAVSLALATATGAGSPSPPATLHVRGGIRHLPRYGVDVPLTTPQAVQRALGIPPMGTVYVSRSPGKSLSTQRGHFYGIIWLLYNKQHHGISDNAPGSMAKRRIGIRNVIINILEDIAGGLVTWILIEVSKGVYKYVKKWIYKGKHGGIIYHNAGDGRCLGDFKRGLDDRLASCTDRNGIYWTVTRNWRMENTLTGGMQIASSLSNGTKLYTWYPAKDFYKWTYENICAPGGC